MSWKCKKFRKSNIFCILYNRVAFDQVLEESIAELRKNLANTKQEEEALLSEMDVTGQAFEDMQEQNMRLLQQLREKDDANFKLMSEVGLMVMANGYG